MEKTCTASCVCCSTCVGFISGFSVLLKRGADCNMEDTEGARPDDLATMAHAADCCDLIGSYRTSRIKDLAQLVEKVRVNSIYA